MLGLSGNGCGMNSFSFPSVYFNNGEYSALDCGHAFCSGKLSAGAFIEYVNLSMVLVVYPPAFSKTWSPDDSAVVPIASEARSPAACYVLKYRRHHTCRQQSRTVATGQHLRAVAPADSSRATSPTPISTVPSHPICPPLHASLGAEALQLLEPRPS